MGDQLKPGKKTLKIIRVPYGEKNTLPQDRDYKMNVKPLSLSFSPAGNLSDWINYALEHKYTAVEVEDKIMNEHYTINL